MFPFADSGKFQEKETSYRHEDGQHFRTSHLFYFKIYRGYHSKVREIKDKLSLIHY